MFVEPIPSCMVVHVSNLCLKMTVGVWVWYCPIDLCIYSFFVHYTSLLIIPLLSMFFFHHEIAFVLLLCTVIFLIRSINMFLYHKCFVDVCTSHYTPQQYCGHLMFLVLHPRGIQIPVFVIYYLKYLCWYWYILSLSVSWILLAQGESYD